MVFKSRVMWNTSVPILVFLGLSVLDLGPMYVTERQTSDRQTADVHHRLMPPTLGAGHNNQHSTEKTYSYVISHQLVNMTYL